MGAFIDLTGKKFGRLTVQYKTDKKQRNEWIWHCLCDCGNEYNVIGSSLRAGRTKSCGCLKKETDRATKNTWDDLTNKTFGHLTVIKRVESDKYGHARWECQCDCGNPNTIIVLADNLKRGHTISCGCEKLSHGEIAVSNLLNLHKIPYEREKILFKFSNNANAKFDFYVNNTYLIEYDGETHYQYNLHGWHNQKQLQAQQERDIIKNQWCKDNNIPLIRIPYWHLPDLCIEDLLLETSKFIMGKECDEVTHDEPRTAQSIRF